MARQFGCRQGLAKAQRLAGHFNAMATTLQQVQADNAELTQALMALQERERAHLGQTLHDDLGQYLTGIRAQACLLRVVTDQPHLLASTVAPDVRLAVPVRPEVSTKRAVSGTEATPLVEPEVSVKRIKALGAKYTAVLSVRPPAKLVQVLPPSVENW